MVSVWKSEFCEFPRLGYRALNQLVFGGGQRSWLWVQAGIRNDDLKGSALGGRAPCAELRSIYEGGDESVM